MRRTKAEAEQTRESVIAAAIAVFLERGVARATFDEIARTAGVTRGAVYWHFQDKLELFQVLERRADLPNEELGDRLRARLAANPGLDPLDELASTIRDGLHLFEANVERCRILTILWLRCEYVGEMLPALERRQRADAAMQELFVKVIAMAAVRGELAPGWSPDLAGRALLLLINGSVEYWLRSAGNARLTVETMSLVGAFIRTIRVPAPATAGL
jgi:TetR/AcrR family transcriptional regulator, acrAB operon repressor